MLNPKVEFYILDLFSVWSLNNFGFRYSDFELYHLLGGVTWKLESM